MINTQSAFGLCCLLFLSVFGFSLDASAATAAPRIATAGVSGTCSGGLCLTVTVTTDAPPACGTATHIDVATGTPVNFCYTVTNQSGVALDYHTLDDTDHARIFWLLEQPLAPDASYQYNRVLWVRGDTTVDATWTAQDAQPTYTDVVTGNGFVDIAATGTPLGIANEAIVGVDLPFAFEFYGRSATHLCVSSDGFVLFDLAPCPTYSYHYSELLPSASMPAPALLPLWQELIADTGEVYAGTLGTAPNRRFVIEWFDRRPYGATDGFTFELILDEATGRVSFEYADVNTVPSSFDNGAHATIGIQANDTLATLFSFYTPSITSGSGIEWTPTSPQIFSASASASVGAGGPVMTIAPAALRARILSGTSTSAPLAIGNTGTATLTWSLSETPSRGPTQAGADPTPVFAEDLSTSRFVSFDASDPTVLVPVADTDYELAGGDFVDNDPTHLYALDGSSAAHRNTLAVVDTTTGAATEIGPAVPLGEAKWTSLKWDHSTQTLYAVAADCAYTNSTLYTIDRSSGAATRIGPISTGSHNCIATIAIDPSGNMFGIDLVSDDALVGIDKTTGMAHRIGMIGVSADGSQGMDFDDASGLLYWARYAEMAPGDYVSEIRTINTITGAATLVAPIGSDAPQINALSVGSAGDCSHPEDLPWLSVTPTSGTSAAGDVSYATIALDAGALTAGAYHATVCVIGNDSNTPVQEFPIELVVIDADDVVFRNGFDGA
jgi:hypothetical protein